MERMSDNLKSGYKMTDPTGKTEKRKDYMTPELTHYGGISTLVLGFPVNGVDGGQPPPFERPS